MAGTVEASCLPPGLTSLTLSGNQFSGTMNWTGLPRTLTTLYVHANNFSGGTVDWPALGNVNRITISNSRLTGTIDLRYFFGGQDLYVDVSGNNLTGSLDLNNTAQFESLTLYVGSNMLSGTLDMAAASVHANLLLLYAAENNFTGSLNLTHWCDSYFNFESNSFCGLMPCSWMETCPLWSIHALIHGMCIGHVTPNMTSQGLQCPPCH